jgi:hypothetical protein
MRLFVVVIIAAFLLAFNYGKPEAAHKIGEKFGGGIVFYVDATGEHGLKSKMVQW